MEWGRVGFLRRLGGGWKLLELGGSARERAHGGAKGVSKAEEDERERERERKRTEQSFSGTFKSAAPIPPLILKGLGQPQFNPTPATSP